MIAAAKRSLRADLRRRIAATAPGRDRAADRAATARVLSMPEWSRACGILVYAPMVVEVDTRPLLADAIARWGRVAVPAYEADADRYRPRWIRSAPGDLRPGRWGIPEPVNGERATAAEIDFAVLPGIGFDRRGGRLGNGRGYIDELCAWQDRESPTKRMMRVGAGFSWQIVDQIPMDVRDAVMDWVATENELIRVVRETVASAPGRDRR